MLQFICLEWVSFPLFCVFQSDLSDKQLEFLDRLMPTYIKRYPLVGIMDYIAEQKIVHQHVTENPLMGQRDSLHDHHKDDLFNCVKV